MQDNLKAALYIRVSTEEQAAEGQSAPAQVETLRQYCKAYGMEVFDIYMDLGVSGKRLKDRLELARLMDDCTNRKFELVLVWKISRLSRNLKDLLYLIDLFERNNVYFTSCSERFDTSTPVGRMTLQLLGSIAEFERNTIIENVKLGLKEFARKGGKASTVLGYDNVNKRLSINENEARIVKLVFNLFTETDMNFTSIAGYLNSLGCRTKRGSEFRCSNISYIIHNPVYIGINRHRMNRSDQYSINGTHPSIIDHALWNKAQQTSPRLKVRAVRDNRNSDPYLFQVTCMKCNMPLRVFYTFSRGKKYRYFRCCSCSNYVNLEKLTRAVSKAVITVLEDRSLQKSAYSLITGNSVSHAREGMEITTVNSEINRLKRSKTRYLSLFEGYKLSDTNTFIDRIAEIEAQLIMLEHKKLEIGKAALASNTTGYFEGYFDELKTRLSALEPDAIKQTAALVKSIEAYKSEIKIVLYL